MFAFFTRSRPGRTPAVSRFVSLSLERLEDRLSPSGTSPNPSPGPPAPPPPSESITLNVTYLANQQAAFSGQLTNQSGPIVNQTVNLTGVVNTTVTTDAQGNYSITATVPQLGLENAASADGLSNTAQYTLVNGAPVISNFDAVSQGNGVWQISGNVSGAPTQGEIVNFGGINALIGQSVSVNADGSFSFYVTIASGQGGLISAEAVDWWGDTSATSTEFVNC
jgi:hypothetical protein